MEQVEAIGTPHSTAYSAEEVPVVDIGPWLDGEPGGFERAARQAGAASESLGFFFIRNHRVPQPLSFGEYLTQLRRTNHTLKD